MESTTRGPSRQSGDRSLAPDNAGDIIGTKLGNILTNDIHEVFNYSYISYILLLSTVYHSRNILYIYIYISNNQRDHIPKQEGKMEKSCNTSTKFAWPYDESCWRCSTESNPSEEKVCNEA